MFITDLAKDALARKNIQVVAGIISPTHDEYKDHKPTLITSKHRVAMVQVGPVPQIYSP